MQTPPKRLDGAVVLHYATLSTRHRQTGVTKHFIDGHEAESPLAIAICQYAGTDTVYIFCCGADWNVMTDELCDSVSDAIHQAERQFKGLTELEWVTMEDSTHELEIARKEEAAAIAALPGDYAAEDTIRRLASEGNDLEAIARLRRLKGQSLLEAYTFVSQIKKQSSKGDNPVAPP